MQHGHSTQSISYFFNLSRLVQHISFSIVILPYWSQLCIFSVRWADILKLLQSLGRGGRREKGIFKFLKLSLMRYGHQWVKSIFLCKTSQKLPTVIDIIILSKLCRLREVDRQCSWKALWCNNWFLSAFPLGEFIGVPGEYKSRLSTSTHKSRSMIHYISPYFALS